MAMQICNRRVTQVTTNLIRQVAKPIPMKVEDDHHDDEHTHIPVPKTPTPKTFLSMNKHLLRGNASITTGLTSMSLEVFLLLIDDFRLFSCS
jgi:hypothetical protein